MMSTNENQAFSSALQPVVDDDGINIAEYYDILLDNRWLVIFIALVVFFAGAGFAFFSKPVYEANLTVQVEDSDKSPNSFLGDAASSLFNVKTPTAGEIEIIRSRMILAQAVENTKLYISSQPKYIPIVGAWLARRSNQLSDPKSGWLSGYVSGTESITVPQFDVPVELENIRFTLTVKDQGFELSNPAMRNVLSGQVGQLSEMRFGKGSIRILISALNGKPGAKFEIVRYSKQQTVSVLQDALRISEKGRQSGVLDVTYQHTDAVLLTELLNEIGRLYVRQNIERKAAEAEKTLGFLDTELPKFKRQLEQSEDTYNRYRNQNGTVSLDDEARNALAQTIDLQSKLIDAQQKRREASAKFTDRHPAVQTLDQQIAAWNREIAAVDGRIRKMPMLQQNALRMQRDIKVNTDLYVSLLNNSLQLRLAKEGKVGNVRLIDEAVQPEFAVKPKKPLILASALVIGLLLGAIAAIMKNSFFGGIRNPNEIEIHTGLNVYSTIPLSDSQKSIDKDVSEKAPGSHVLAISHPEDPAVEALRSLRTALQFTMLDSRNNRILISGATPGVGKSFVSVNFSAILAATGKRVILIDADLRKGHINNVFSLSRSHGLSGVISGAVSFDQAVIRNVLPNLDLLTTGPLPPNPAELLMSSSFSQLLELVSGQYDYVIIDTAPVLVAADTSAVAPQAGTVLLVARAEKTQLGEINESVKRLTHVGSHVNGVILNAMDFSRRHYGSYGYKYGAYKYTLYQYGKDNT